MTSVPIKSWQLLSNIAANADSNHPWLISVQNKIAIEEIHAVLQIVDATVDRSNEVRNY